MARAFTWDKWDFDGSGNAYIVAVDECPEKEKVPFYIVKEDRLLPKCTPEMQVEEGWCKYMVRADFEDYYGKPIGAYVCEKYQHMTTAFKGKRGWFKVWIVRTEGWY